MIKKLLFFFLLLFSCNSWAYTTVPCTYSETGTCRQAADCSYTEVSSAVTASSSGDGVYLPACSTTTWANYIDLGAKSLVIAGAGRTATYIASSMTTSAKFFRFSADNVRITGIDFTTNKYNTSFIESYNGARDFRVYNNTFNSNDNTAGSVSYAIVTTHNYISSQYPRGLFDGNIINDKIGAASQGTYPGASTVTLGNEEALYIENNTFNLGGSRPFDGNYGSNIVVRYNDIVGSGSEYVFEQHGIQGETQQDAALKWEFYNNRLTGTFSNWGEIHAATGVFYNNYANAGSFSSNNVRLQDVRSSYFRGPTLYYFGICNGSGAVDGNTEATKTGVSNYGTGTHDGATSTTTMTDTGRTGANEWTTNEFVVTTMSAYASGTHTPAGSSNTVLTNSSANWLTTSTFSRPLLQWLKNTTDGSACLVTGNTSTTLTCSAGLAGGSDNLWQQGDAYTLHNGYWIYNLSACTGATKDTCANGMIVANTANTATVTLAGGSRQNWQNGDNYFITGGYPCRGQIGRGGDDIAFPASYAVGNTYPSQALMPAYFYNNKAGTSEMTVYIYNFGMSRTHIVSGRDYYTDRNPESYGYTQYECPHPLADPTDTYDCDSTKYGTEGYMGEGGNPPTVALTITAGAGNGTGTITSTPSGINCTITAGATSGTCQYSYNTGAEVQLTYTTADAACSNPINTWSVGCTGTGICSVTMTTAKGVTSTAVKQACVAADSGAGHGLGVAGGVGFSVQ